MRKKNENIKIGANLSHIIASSFSKRPFRKSCFHIHRFSMFSASLSAANNLVRIYGKTNGSKRKASITLHIICIVHI